MHPDTDLPTAVCPVCGGYVATRQRWEADEYLYRVYAPHLPGDEPFQARESFDECRASGRRVPSPFG